MRAEKVDGTDEEDARGTRKAVAFEKCALHRISISDAIRGSPPPTVPALRKQLPHWSRRGPACANIASLHSSTTMHPFGGTPICPKCSKAVYAAEQVGNTPEMHTNS